MKDVFKHFIMGLIIILVIGLAGFIAVSPLIIGHLLGYDRVGIIGEFILITVVGLTSLGASVDRLL